MDGPAQQIARPALDHAPATLLQSDGGPTNQDLPTIAIATGQSIQHVGHNIYNDGDAATKQNREYDTILEWLAPSTEATSLQRHIHQQATDAQAADTGRWFINDERLHHWLCGSSSPLWLYGSSKLSLKP